MTRLPKTAILGVLALAVATGADLAAAGAPETPPRLDGLTGEYPLPLPPLAPAEAARSRSPSSPVHPCEVTSGFEEPSLGTLDSMILDPYVDPRTGVVYTAEQSCPPWTDAAVGLVKNRATSACVPPADDDQLVGTGRWALGHVGLSGFVIRATFPLPLAGPATVETEFISGAGNTARIRLFDDSDVEVGRATAELAPPVGVCPGDRGNPRARTRLAATSVADVAYALLDMDSGTCRYVFDVDDLCTSIERRVAIAVEPAAAAASASSDEAVLTVTFLGSAAFDVTRIDPTTVELDGVPARSHRFSDRATASTPGGTGLGRARSDEAGRGGDGFVDLTVELDRAQAMRAVADQTGAVAVGPVTIEVCGDLFDGLRVCGQDEVTIPRERPTARGRKR